jgi:CRISPR type III-associated protein (TIGR04423 family)
MEKIEGKFEGYVWMSDAERPEICLADRDTEIALDETANPFVIEAALFDKTRSESLSVSFVDGHYIIARRHVEPGDLQGNDHATPKTYLPHRMPGKIRGLKYIQYWKDVDDPLCEGMTTLQPSDLVFAGFDKAEE